MIAPAFTSAPTLRDRLDGSAMGLIDAAILPPAQAREALSRELLALSSLLSVARTGGLLSEMNADLIIREAHLLLQEIASYEEPRLFMDDVPSLAELAKRAPDVSETSPSSSVRQPRSSRPVQPQSLGLPAGSPKGHLSDISTATPKTSTRQEAIVGILRTKGPSYIKDISTLIRDVSEKTIQRELQALVSAGLVHREGERRWTQYSVSDSVSA
jgi:DNA-binding transcriptional ArsR family regulator